MSITKLKIEEFIKFSKQETIIDVRSPGEYDHAHIPNALSVPLFTNEERKVVGTAYKKESREKAIKIGLDYFGPKSVSIIETVERIKRDTKSHTKEIGLYCWRGGMRSAAIAWLLDLYGFKVNLLVGGYKTYRNWALKQFEKQYNLKIIGGYTGSNKTGILKELTLVNEKTIDLEALANHKGSAFGNLNLNAQPSQEMFENLLAFELYNCNESDNAIIWIEDEGQRLGNVNIPTTFFKTMRQQPVLFLDIPFNNRLEHIMQGYSSYSKEKIINGIIRIKKKLGGLETKNAVNFIIEDDIKNCFIILLNYYDRLYLKSTYKREMPDITIRKLEFNSTDANANSKKIIQYVYNK